MISGKTYMMAIRALPEEWVDEKTDIMPMLSREGIVAVHPNIKPIIYESGEWRDIKLGNEKAND